MRLRFGDSATENKMAKTRNLVFGTIIAFMIGAFISDRANVFGQLTRTRLSPSSLRRPPLSPYLGLLNAPRGPLPSYHERVRPEQRFNAAVRRQSRSLQNQQQFLFTIEAAVNDKRRRATSPTGGVGGFVNYSHFYPGLSSRPVRR